jgi:predicted transcriptional regulator of viral defense system
MVHVFDYLQDLQSRGRYCFTTADAVRDLGRGVTAVRAALRRLKEKGLLADPYRGFHLIVPPEYRRLGCLPADQYLPELMEHLGEPYYVALLSAAVYHGAAHQRPQGFQAMVPRARRAIRCGEVRVDFTARREMATTPTVSRTTPRGVLRVASPEATALELVGYPEPSGGLDNVATVLGELAETIDGAALELEARRGPLAWVQRLGYLLSFVGAEAHASALDPVLRDGHPFTVALAPSRGKSEAPRDLRWNVAVNVDIETDQ